MKIGIKPHFNAETQEAYNAIYVGDILFDWDIDKESLIRAKKFAGDNKLLRKSVVGNIQKHFLDSFSEFIGKPITLAEVNNALIKGEL